MRMSHTLQEDAEKINLDWKNRVCAYYHEELFPCMKSRYS